MLGAFEESHFTSYLTLFVYNICISMKSATLVRTSDTTSFAENSLSSGPNVHQPAHVLIEYTLKGNTNMLETNICTYTRTRFLTLAINRKKGTNTRKRS